jgi:hypothetical protein
MTLPVKANTTCDIYRTGRAPPTAPDVGGVPCYLLGNYYAGLEHGEGDSTTLKYSHTMLVDVSTDVRDGYVTGVINSVYDTAYVPDKTGVGYNVVFVERKRVATGDFKKVYLARKAPAWPNTTGL